MRLGFIQASAVKVGDVLVVPEDGLLVKRIITDVGLHSIAWTDSDGHPRGFGYPSSDDMLLAVEE
jgi:hypothetical protein